MKWVPNALTAVGFAYSMVGVVLLPSRYACLLLVMGLLFDVLDGKVARHFDACTRFGAMFDWWCDVVVGNAISTSMILSGHPIPAVACVSIMLVCQLATGVWNAWGIRTSGRVWCTAIVIIVCTWGAP